MSNLKASSANQARRESGETLLATLGFIAAEARRRAAETRRRGSDPFVLAELRTQLGGDVRKPQELKSLALQLGAHDPKHYAALRVALSGGAIC